METDNYFVISKNNDGFFQVLIMEMYLLEVKDFVPWVAQETLFKHEQMHWIYPLFVFSA